MEKSTISRNKIINQLLHIGHGDLGIYTPVGLQAVQDEAELFAHLIAWNFEKGEVRDSKVAFPVLALRGDEDLELYENAVAHLLLLDPRNLVRAVLFHKELKNLGYTVRSSAKRMMKNGIEQYIRVREGNKGWWTRTALQHRSSLKELYARSHIKPNPFAQAILFEKKKPQGTVFEAISHLKTMSPMEAAGTILHYKIPFIVAVGALGGLKNKPDIIMALIDQMSGNELINNTEMLRRMGVFENPVLKSSYDSAVERMRNDKRVSTLKATKAAKAIKDEKISQKMQHIQEEKLTQLGGIDGDWLVLGDRSGSMQKTIQLAREIASLISQQVNGNVHLVFFNTSPTRYDVTGKTLKEINDMTSRVKAVGGTSIGCGLELINGANIVVNGIVICSDGGDNTHPYFHQEYKKYALQTGIAPTVYLFHVHGDRDVLSHYCQMEGIPVQKFDMSKADYYSLPNLIKTLRSNRYTLVDEIMQQPLLTISQALRKE